MVLAHHYLRASGLRPFNASSTTAAHILLIHLWYKSYESAVVSQPASTVRHSHFIVEPRGSYKFTWLVSSRISPHISSCSALCTYWLWLSAVDCVSAAKGFRPALRAHNLDRNCGCSIASLDDREIRAPPTSGFTRFKFGYIFFPKAPGLIIDMSASWLARRRTLLPILASIRQNFPNYMSRPDCTSLRRNSLRNSPAYLQQSVWGRIYISFQRTLPTTVGRITFVSMFMANWPFDLNPCAGLCNLLYDCVSPNTLV